MHDVHLASLDLNLLVALRALLSERHVTRAATRIGLTQPAMSHALSRLRDVLDDPILVRTSNGMTATPRAEALTAPLERTLAELERLLAPPSPFEPSTAKRTFSVAASDYVELVLFPRVVARLREEAPGVDLRAINMRGRTDEAMADGRLDLAIGLREACGEGLPARDLRGRKAFDETFVCVVRGDHPRVKRKLSLDEFVALPHALISPRGEAGSIVDTALAKLGRKRRVAVEVPHFLVAPHIVATSDLVLTIAARVARMFAPMLGLRQLTPPVELEGFSMWLVWHERVQTDPAQIWFRRVILEEAKKL